ncbi:metallophosphoesterase [Campylobacter lari]|nr:metallophosphoesterase [Campylobacter lari]ECP5280119.1 metallophosphoesterase [Campylobacter lari]
MRVFVFFTLLVLFFALANWYIYKRFFCKLSILKKHKINLKYFLICVFLVQVLFFLSMKTQILNEKLYFILAIFPSITCFLLLSSFIYEIGSFIFFNKKEREGNFNLQRRKFLKLIFDSWLIILAISLIFKGFINAISLPKIKEICIKNKKIKKDLNIALISDVHLGKNLGKEFLQGLIGKINTLNADIIIIAGDLIDADIASMSYIDLLENFKSKYGTYFVYGNHEYYNDINAISKKLKTLKNFKVLEDESIDFGDFTLSGTLDLAAKRLGFKESNIEKIKTQINQEKVNILITHQPKYVKTYDVSGFDLILSGHTHAGQIFPFSLLVYLEQGFVHGLYKLSKDSLLYVSSGAGFWGPAVRFLAPSEIALIKLKGE